MAIDKNAGSVNDVAKMLIDELRDMKKDMYAAGEDHGDEYIDGFKDNVKKRSKEVKSEMAKIFEDFNRTTNNFKSRKSVTQAEWTRVIGLSKELMKSERYADSVREKLSDISVTFKNGVNVSGLEKVLAEFEKVGGLVESVQWAEAGKNYRKKNPTKKPSTKKPKVETPVVQADPVPVVKAEEKKQEVIENTTAAIQSQVDAIKKLNQVQLKRVKSTSGYVDKNGKPIKYTPETYTALDGRYRIEKGTVGWNLYDHNGQINEEFVTSYETLKELREDLFRISQEEAKITAVNTDAIVKQSEAIEKVVKQVPKMESVIKRYNKLMHELGLEHLTIGEQLSEDTGGWGLNEMVKEAKFQLDRMLHFDGEQPDESWSKEATKRWKSETGKLQRFIAAYEQYAETTQATAPTTQQATTATKKQTEALREQEDVRKAIARLNELNQDPYNIKDEKEVNRIYQERLAIIKQIGEEKLKAYSEDEYEGAQNVNQEYKSRLTGFAEARDNDIYDEIWNRAFYDNEQVQSAQELEQLLEKRLGLLQKISLTDSDTYAEELEENKLIEERIALMKKLEPLVASGAISKNDLEEIVFENGAFGERIDTLNALRMNTGKAFDETWDDALQDAQMFLDVYEKILVTTASGKKLELGPDMSMEDYRAFLKMDNFGATDIEFVRKQTQALNEQEAATESAAKTVVEQNKITISSYQDLYAALEKVVNLSKQLKPEYTAGYGGMYEMAYKAGYPDSKESLIASIKAQYDNVQRIKTSIKNGLSVYKDIDGDGYEATYNIDNNTLKNAENMLHGYIYQAVEYFGYSVADAMNDFDKKRIRTFVEKEINKYLEVSSKNDEYRMDAEAFNAPIRDAIESITDTIINMATDAKSNERVFDSLAELKSRLEDVNRYTLSTQANHIGSNIGLSTPYSEIQENVKKIETYEELCELVARYNELQERNVTFGGTEHAGLDEAEEMELRRLRARLEATGGKDIYKLSSFRGFDNVDKLADAMGIADKKAEEAQKEIEAAYLEAEQFVAKCKEIQNQEIFDDIDCSKLLSDLETAYAKLMQLKEEGKVVFGADDPENLFYGATHVLEYQKRVAEAAKDGIVYHAGVLGNVERTMKSRPLGSVVPVKSGEGNSLTGLYTTPDWDGFVGNEWSGAPISTIDINQYKLFDARRKSVALQAHAFFDNLNGTIYGYQEYFDYEVQEMAKTTDVKSIESLYTEFKNVFVNAEMSFEQFAAFIKESAAIVKGHDFKPIDYVDIDEGVGKSYSTSALQGVSKEIFNSDSFSTRLMKMLGYEGLDTRGSGFDSTYRGGTVIFDVKPESIISTDGKWSELMSRHGVEIDEKSLEREEKRRQLAFDTAKAYSQQADTAKEVVQLTDNYNSELDESNNKLMQGTKLVNEQGQIIRLFHNSDSVFDKFTSDNMSESNMLGKGHYLSFDQEQYQSYGKYQTQWYANVQKMFDANAANGMSSDDATKIIETYCTDAVESFCKRMFNELTSGSASDALSAAMQIAEAYNVDISDVFKTAGYDSVRINDEINVFDPSKIYRANDSVLQHDNSDKNAEEIKRINAERAKQLQEFVEATKSMFSGELTPEESSVMTEILNKISIEGMSAAEAIQELSNALEVLHAQQEEVERAQKHREGMLNAYAEAASSFLGDSEYDAVSFDDKNRLYENFYNKIAEGSIFASDAMDQLYLSMEELRKQSEAMPDDVIESFGGDSEQIAEAVSQLQKLSSVDVTRIFDSVDLKAFLEMFNIDKSNFATFRALFEELMQITKAMGDGVDVGNAFDVKMAEITDTVMRLGGHMIDLDDGGYATMMQDFYKYMSNIKIQFNDTIKAEYTKDQWKSLYRTNKNRLTSDVTKGIPVDSLYQELNDKWPGLFPESENQQADFKLIIEKLDEARKLQENNWKVLQGFVSSDRDSIQGSVDDLYEKMSDALFVSKEIEATKVESDVDKNLDSIKQATEEQSDDLEQQIAAAEQAKENLDKAFQNVKSASSRAVLKGQTKADFEDFARQIANDSGMELGTVAVSRDEMDQMRLATIKLINKELAQSITYTYDIQENAEGVNEAFLRSSYAIGDANKALENARKKEEQDAKKKLQNDTWLYAQRGKLDTQQRRYTDPDRGIDGKLSIMSTETSLADDAEHTIESLANHIRENIKKSLSDGLTDEVKRKIISDLEILENEIKVRQSETYSSTTMKSSQFETNKKAYQEYMKAFTARAQKSGVFSQMAKTISDLNAELNSVSDAKGFSQFVDNFKIARNKLQAEIGELSRDTKMLQSQLSAFSNEEKAYNKIFANIRAIGEDNIGDGFAQKIYAYQDAAVDLRKAMDNLKANPEDSDHSLHKAFDDAAFKVKNARVEIEGILKESQKLDQVMANMELFESENLDPSELKNLQQAMLSFASSVEDGVFKFKGFNKAGTEMYGTLEQSSGAIKNVTVALKQSSDQLFMYGTNANRADNEWEEFKNTLASGTKNLVGMYVGFQEGVQAIRSGVEAVKQIDLAMTELKKVTDETDDSYREFLEDAGRTSAVIGSTVSDFTEASATFARLGYSLDEASSMAETAIVYKNVADGLDTVEESSESIISTMMAFGIEANDTMSIIDRFNAVGNNFAITSAGIGDALQRSASALFEAGNTIDESIALVTAANSVIQNPEQVGTALKTLSLRIRGVKTELEEAGLETEGMAETTAQLQAKLKALTNGKVDIMLNADEFKSTVQVLREMSGVWSEMTDVQQAAALELLGGKRQANILSSVITNFQTVEDVIATSMNSAGSAMEENEKYLDSIQGRIDIFNNSLQTFWNNVISSDVAKWTVDRGTDIISILDTTTGKVIALASAIHLITKFKGINISGVFQDLQKSIEQINSAKTTLNALTFKDTTDGAFNPSDISAYASAVSALTPKMQAQALAASGLNEIQIKNALSTNHVSEENMKLAMAQVHATKSTQQYATVTGQVAQAILESQGITLSSAATDFLKEHSTEQVTKAMLENAVTAGTLTVTEKTQIATALGLTGANHGLATSFKAVGTAISFAFKSNPLGFILSLASTILAAIPIVKGLADTFTDSAEEIKEQAQEISNAYSKTVDEINSNFKKLKIDDDGSIAALTKEFETLTAGVDRYGNNLSLTSDQYGRYKEICEQIVDINPRIASGYDSATEAIGNNAYALSQLVKFQKERARLAAEEYVNDENLETLAKDEVNDYKDAQKQRGKVAGKRNELFGMLSQGSTKDTMKYILRTLGYGEAEIASTIQRYYLYAMKDYDSSRFMVDFIDEIDKKYKNFDGHVDELDKFFDEYENTIRNGEKSIEEAQNGLVDKLLIVPKSSKNYDKLTSEGKNFLIDWINNNKIFKMDESTTAEDVQGMRDTILDMMDVLVDEAKTIDYNGEMVGAQDILEQIYNLDPSNVNYEDYKAQINTMLGALWNSLSQDQKDKYGFAGFNSFRITFGFDFKTEKNQIETAKNQVAGFLDVSTDEIQKKLDGMTAKEVKAFYSIDWNEVGKDGVGSWQDVVKQIHASIQGDNVVPVKTYSVLTESVSGYNDILAQTSEIVTDSTEVTQEYKDALLELGVSETELNECFDESNGLVVKNSKQLNKLVKSAKKNVAENIKLAKSQARLEYYDLYKQMRDFTRGLDYTSEGYAILTDEQRAQIDSLYAEMDAINSTIARFSTLEAQLLGVTNAYTKFADAQTADEENEYSSQAESMVEAFATALNTGDLGTETAREAMLGLVPEEVYKDLDTVEKKLDAIAKYFNEGELSKYFSIEFDDDGAVEKVDVTRDDLKQFFEAGREKGVFTGNWEHFDLSEDVTSLEQFAKAMNITEEVAFALFEALENHDAGNLFDPSNILDKFMSGNIEYQAYNNAKAMAELQYQLANGTISAEEYAKKMVGLDGQLAAGAITQDEYKTAVANLRKQLEDGTITQQEYNDAALGLANQQDKIAEDAYNQATAYYDKSKALEDCNKKLKEYNDLLSDEDGLDKDGNPIDKEQVEKDIEDVSNEIQKLMGELESLGEPTEMTISLASDYVQEQIDGVEDSIKDLANNESDILVKIDTKFEEVQNSDFDLSQFGLSKDGNGNWTGVAEFITSMGLNPADQATIDAVTNYINLVDKQHTLNLLMGPETTTVLDTLADINNTLKDIATKLGVDYTLDVKTNLDDSQVTSFLDTPLSKTISVSIKKVGDWLSGFFANGTVHANGTAHARGTAYASGSWGAPKTETALVGELGAETIVRNGRWFTVGEHGAEFTQVKKGDIIFNHKQTKQLLENGYVTSRGKLKGGSAFASGTAYAGIYTYDKYRNKEKTAYQGSNVSNSASKLSKAAKDISKASDKLSDDFKEIFDWIEVRIEEITGALDVRGAKLENAVGFKKQNAVVDDMIELNQKLYDNLTAGASKYYEYASKLLAKVPAEYRKAAQDGSIAIESFVGKVGESTLEAIQDYREWVQKGDDATQQAEEVLTEISSLAKQAIDNISQDFENKTSLNDNKIDQLEAYNALLETDNGFESEKIYQEIIKANNANIDQLKKQRKEMQAELNAQVEAGDIKKYSQDWYDAVNEIAAVDTEIIELTTDTENYQDAINELHWDKFDALVGRLEAVSEEAENLIDILGNKDLVDESGNWTDEGITTLGLYAQQMEAAEVQAKKYQEEIKYLNNNWQALGYTEEEYIEKLNELKDGQYDAIKAYHESKDAIVDLNKERIDAIKEGIEKEIEAYEELIEKKKEELDAEKDLFDFQKSIMEQQKDVADLERQLAALSGDNSASARAKRAQLEAELAEAKAALEESYYERSVQNQQEALDKELENFKEAKDKEMEGWDEYLENTEQVVSDSLATVQDNTDMVYQTLAAMGKEYSLSITEAITSPWKDGEIAIQSFSEQFGIAMSSTVEELMELELRFKETMLEIEQAGVDAANKVKENAQGYTETEYQTPKKEDTKKEEKPKEESKTIKVGGKINASGAKIYDYVGDKSGSKQYYSKDPIYVVLGEQGGYLKVRHHKSKSGVTGWFKKSDVKAYAKGSMGVNKDQWALIDELGDELQLVPGENGRLAYVKKGTGIVPADLTERLVNLAMDPQEMLDRNRPSIGAHPEVHHTEISIDNSIGELIHIDNCSTETLPDIKKIVNDALEKHTQKLNQSLRRYTR